MIQFVNAKGATPIRQEDEKYLLEKHIRTQSELDAWEEGNIAKAQKWIRSGRIPYPLSEEFVWELHHRMFDETWTFAG